MSVTGTLAALALRYTLGVSADKVIDAVGKHFTDHSQALSHALVRANDRAWKAVRLALAGDSVSDRVRALAGGGDMMALRDQLRAILASTSTGQEASAEIRARAFDELNQLRKADRLALKPNGSDIESDIRRYSDASNLVANAAEAVATVADALAADAPYLAQVLRLAPPGGIPMLAIAFQYFVRHEVETNDELSRGLTFDSLRALTATQDRGFALLADRTAGTLDQIDALFDAMGDGFAGVNAKVDKGFVGMEAKLDAGFREIQKRLAEPKKPGVSYDTDDERAFLKTAREQFRKNAGQVSAEQWTRLGDAMNAARLYAAAGEAHETAATTARAVRDTTAEAANHYKAYLDACAAGAWLRAFERLGEAIDLEPARYRPFDNHRYKPLCILGGGAFGTVFHCHDDYDHDDDGKPRSVAIKSFRTDALDSDLTKVFAEARILKALGHTSIIGIHDQGFADPAARARPYLVLEYFPGRALDVHVAEFGPLLPIADFLAVARRVAEGVHAAHTRPRPIYHRDLKPSNVMVLRNPDGTWAVKVIDFGLAVGATAAKAGGSVPLASRSTREKSGAGTLRYAPPEQLGELPGVAVGPYSDVYAFGKTCLDVLFRTVAPKSWDWKKLPDEYRGPLQELLERCTADTIEHRYPNFAPVLAALTALASVGEANGERLAWERAEQKRQAEEVERARVAAEVALNRQVEQAERVRVETEAARIAAEQRAREDAGRREEEGRRQETDRTRREQEAAQQKQREEVSHQKAEEARSEHTPHMTDDRAAGTKLKVTLPGGVVMRFAWCPPGSFLMGSDHPEAVACELCRDERPVHKVALTMGFFMGIYPVTQAQWKAVMGTDPSRFKGANRPVESVRWGQCQEFCTKLTGSLKGRATVRLPTEAEWEYACRAGTTTEYHFGDVINTNLANYNGQHSWNGSPEGEYRKETTDVGSFPPNPWGLYDVHGNVREWCADWYGPYGANNRSVLPSQFVDRERMLRGGCWSDTPDFCRAAFRLRYFHGMQPYDLGFRVCFHFDAHLGKRTNSSRDQQPTFLDRQGARGASERASAAVDRTPFSTGSDASTATERVTLRVDPNPEVLDDMWSAWAQAVEAILREDFDQWDACWAAVREEAGTDRAGRLLDELFGTEGNEQKLSILPTDVRNKLRAACADVTLFPPHTLLVPVSLGELETLLRAQPDWAGYTAFTFMAADERKWLAHVTQPDRDQMRERVRDFLFAAPPTAFTAYIRAAWLFLDDDPSFLTALFTPYSDEAAALMDKLLASATLEPDDWLKMCGAVGLLHDAWGDFLLEKDRLANLLFGLGGDGGDGGDGGGADVWGAYLGLLTPALVSPDLIEAEGYDGPVTIHTMERQVYEHLRAAADRLTAVGVNLTTALSEYGVEKLSAATNLIKWVETPAIAERDGPDEVKETCRFFGIDPLHLVDVVYRSGGYNQLDPAAEPQKFAPLVALFRVCFPVDQRFSTAGRATREIVRLSKSCPARSQGAFQVRLLSGCVCVGHYRGILDIDWNEPLQPDALAWLRKWVSGQAQESGSKDTPLISAPTNIQLTCPACGCQLEIDKEFEGQEIECGSCLEVFVAKAKNPPRRPRA